MKYEWNWAAMIGWTRGSWTCFRDTELARLVSEADPATVERIRKVTEAIFRQNRP